jgi:uncharacterized protein YqeY
MSEIKNKIKEDLKEAMRNRDEIAKNTLKGALSSFVNELVATNRTPQDKLNDQETITVLKRLVKQCKDAISKYQEGGREDLVENEKAELEILEKYLPEQMSEEKINKIAQEVKDDLKIEDPSKMGILIGAVMKKTGGEADGSTVQKVVKSLF